MKPASFTFTTATPTHRPVSKPVLQHSRPLQHTPAFQTTSLQRVGHTFGSNNTNNKTGNPPPYNSNTIKDIGKLGVAIAAIAALGPFVGLSIASMLSLPALVFGLAIPTVIDIFTKKKSGPVHWAHQQVKKVAAKGIEFIRARKWLNRWFVGRNQTVDEWADRQYERLHIDNIAKEAEFESQRRGGAGAFSWKNFRKVISHAWQERKENKLQAVGIALLSTSAYMFRAIRKGNSFAALKQPFQLIKNRQWVPAIKSLWSRGMLKGLLNFRFWKALMVGVLLGGLGEGVSRITLTALYGEKHPVLPDGFHIP